MTNIHPVSEYWDIREAAAALKVSTSFLYKKVASGECPHVKAGRLVRFKPSRLIEWFDSYGREPLQPQP